MDMRKMIDDADFDHVQEYSRRWKAEPKGVVEQTKSPNHQDSQPDTGGNQKAKQVVLPPPNSFPPFKRNVVPQVMDQDTEHFRTRLQHLLSTFKTDAVSEFMSMKRDMLEYQRESVKSDTQKYLSLYEQKHQELLQLKDKLISITRDAERKTIQCELMSQHISKLNERVRITRYLSRPFALLYENKERQKMIKFKFTQAGKADNRRAKLKALTGWKNILREATVQKDKTAAEEKVEMEVSDIVGRYQKEMEQLRDRLTEAVKKNEEYQNNRQMMQDNLKKAFLRGISAMNMQAMGIFTSQAEEVSVHPEEFAQSQMENHPMGFSRTGIQNANLNQTVAMGQSMSHITTQSQGGITQGSQGSITQGSQGGTQMSVSRAKIESKDHKWKEAPVLGMQERQQIEQPRAQLVKPVAQGKVIKVVDGRSSVAEVMRKPPVLQSATKTESGSRRKI